jgi:hypothetical protein
MRLLCLAPAEEEAESCPACGKNGPVAGSPRSRPAAARTRSLSRCLGNDP